MPIAPFEQFRAALAHRYEIEREVGRGGMATVYLARDLKLGRPVALKVLRPEVAELLGEHRFKREIELAAPLTHPNILPFIDSDQAGGRLYYVMPYVEGGTLADRLARGPRLPLTEALDIIRQVAAGLAYAHSLGVVHRDIKPANILLAGGHAWIADFGIARMVRQAIADTAERTTDTGLAIGTPEYMSPEQLRGASKVDGRTDEYALACVLFEMLTGKPPISSVGRPGAARRALRAASVTVPARVESALDRALALDTEDRFAGVAEFAAAVEGVVEPRRIRRRRSPLPLLVAAVTAALLGTGLWLKFSGVTPCPAVPSTDTTGYAVFPFENEPGAAPIGEEQLLADALARWSGLRVVDQFQLREVVGRLSRKPVRLEAARQVACRVGVRRLILGNIARFADRDSIRVMARIYDLGPGEAPLAAGVTVRLPSSLAGVDSLFGSLADSLLFRGRPPAGGPALAGTRNLPARQAFDSGQRTLATWDLDAADSAFRAAVTLDPEYAAANLWLALVRAWREREPSLWLGAAERAASGAGHGRASDSLMAAAVLAMGHGDLSRACDIWRNLTRLDASRFVAWYGLSDCLSRDAIVVPDRTTRSGWRFRSSYHEAQRAYLNAIRLLPSILASPDNTVADLSDGLLYITGTRLRRGTAVPPDTTSFIAAPGWAGDTLVFIPVPRADRSRMTALIPADPEAIRQQRLLLGTLARTWVMESPQSLEARLAQIEAMALGVDPTAVDSALSARRLARHPSELVRVLAAEIRSRLQFGIPDRLDYLTVAHALADSVLQRPALREAVDPATLTALAALTGRASLAAAAARLAAALPAWDLPKPLLEAAPALLIYAAMGGPADSIRALSRLTQEAIDQALPAAQGLDHALEDLGRPASLAFPAETLPALFALRDKGDWLLTLQADIASGNRAAFTRGLDSVAAAHRLGEPSLTFDTALPLAALLAFAGDTAQAVSLLEATLSSIRFRPPSRFGDPVEVATMVRAMMLRAVLGHHTGDEASARRWSRSARILWEGADSTFAAEVLLMRQLAR